MTTDPYWQPLFDLMSDEHHLTLIESEMQDIAAAVDECRSVDADFTDANKARVLDVFLSVLNAGGCIRGRKAKLVWVDGKPTLRPIVVEWPKGRKEEPV